MADSSQHEQVSVIRVLFNLYKNLPLSPDQEADPTDLIDHLRELFSTSEPETENNENKETKCKIFEKIRFIFEKGFEPLVKLKQEERALNILVKHLTQILKMKCSSRCKNAERVKIEVKRESKEDDDDESSSQITPATSLSNEFSPDESENVPPLENHQVQNDAQDFHNFDENSTSMDENQEKSLTLSQIESNKTNLDPEEMETSESTPNDQNLQQVDETNGFNGNSEGDSQEIVASIHKPFKCRFTSCSKTFRTLGGCRKHESTVMHKQDRDEARKQWEETRESFRETRQRVKNAQKHQIPSSAPSSTLKTASVRSSQRNIKKKPSLKFPNSDGLLDVSSVLTFPSKIENQVSLFLQKTRKDKKVKPFCCDLCDYRSTQKGNLGQHFIQKHSNLRPFSCPKKKCKYTCKQKTHLFQHMLTHKKEKPFCCPRENCSFDTYQKGNLEQHLKTHSEDGKEFKCTHCEYQSFTRHRIVSHIRHHTEPAQFSCSVCSFKSNHLITVKIHSKIHSAKNPSVNSITATTTESNNEKLLKCKTRKCPFSTDDPKNMALHLNEKHTLPKITIKNYESSICK